jgi:hypothetical protein
LANDTVTGGLQNYNRLVLFYQKNYHKGPETGSILLALVLPKSSAPFLQTSALLALTSWLCYHFSWLSSAWLPK